MKEISDYILHFDDKLGFLIQSYGLWVNGILFLIIFIETGLIIMPFLPGDSLLFVAGTFSAQGFLNPVWLFILLTVAAILGDSVNYMIGRKIGNKIFDRDRPFINEEYLKRTQLFYEKHGKKTIILARFIPIIRTFAPFVAGVARMNYYDFILYNITGGLAWVMIFFFGGYLFGNVPIIKDNLSTVVLIIIAISVVPAIIEFWKHRQNRSNSTL